MKKTIGILLICILLFGLTSCAGGMGVAPTEAPTEPPLTEVESAAKEAIIYLQSTLKNPESLQVHEIQCFHGTDSYKYVFNVNFSAQNGFGGMSRQSYRLCYEEDGTVKINKPYTLTTAEQSSIDPARLGF